MAGPKAQAVLMANLASVFATEGQTEQAREYAEKALSSDPSCRPATLLLVWLELAEGRCEHAVQRLRAQRDAAVKGSWLIGM